MKSESQGNGKRLQIARVFDAPRSVVFSWWTEAEKLQQWSGCKAAIKCEVQMEFRVGGSFIQKMHIAGAGEFSFSGIYEEIVVPEKISYRANLGHGIVTRITIEFFDQGDQTKVVLTQDGFPDGNSCRIVTEGTMESLDKLNSLVAGKTLAHHQ